MPVKPLPSHPNLDHLKHQAKDLLRDHAARGMSAAQRLREFHPGFSGRADAEIFAAKLKLSDAQLAVARERGFASWARLKRRVEDVTASDGERLQHHERIADAEFRRAVDLLDAGDAEGLRGWLDEHPGMVRRRVEFEGGNYFRNPSLLEFVAENPVRRGKLPENIAAVTRVLLDAGPQQAAIDETLMLVATGSVARECGVQGELIGVLCERGADPGKAIGAAVVHCEFPAVQALIERGAKLDLAAAAALGRRKEFDEQLAAAAAEQRHLALALAAQFGHTDIVKALLDAGEDPNRYNPVGGHSHATPLHEAALAGHAEVVRLLLERGARTDIKDTRFGGTALDWARHEGRAECEQMLMDVRPARAAGVRTPS